MSVKCTTRLLTTIWCATMCLAWLSGTTSARAAEVGEDGQPYMQPDDRASWRMGKIEPKLDTLAATESDSQLNVMVYYSAGLLESDTDNTIDQIKQPHMLQIETLSERIANIERKYRPSGPVAPEDEAMVRQAMESSVSFVDQAELNTLRQEIDVQMDTMRAEVSSALKGKFDAGRQTLIDYIIDNGGTVTAHTNVVPMIGASIPASLLDKLANHPLVTSITYDAPVQYELDVSMDSVGFDSWWNNADDPANPIDGGAYDFGVVDSGLQEDHPAFSGVATFYTNSGSSSDTSDNGHGTHVAGIAISGNSTYRGGAYGLDAVIWSLAGSQSGTIDQMEWQAGSAGQSPEVINHSLGYGNADDVDYSDSDAFYDALVINYNIQVSKSAGNENWSDANPTITHPGPAYNILVVANMDDQNTLSRDDDVRRITSSVGPTLNGRKKPDITAPGTNIMSTNNSWSGTGSGNTDPSCWDTRTDRQGYDWSRCSGTSMSAPHVAAAVILMEDGGNNIPMAQKAVLLNTADAWDSNDTSTTTDDGEVTGSHWDKSYGWGYLDMTEAYFNRTDYFANSTLDTVVPKNDTNVDDDYKLYAGYMFTNEKSTLVWQKRSNYVAGEPPSTRYALSDLNIRLYDADNGLQMDSDLDADDNVHQVAASSGSDVVIKVYAWSTNFAGADSERYALATEENFVRADPPALSSTLATSDTMYWEKEFDVDVTVQNNGDVPAHNVTVTLNDGVFTLVSGSSTQNIGTIAAGGSGVATYTVRAPAAPDGVFLYTMSADVTSNCYDETYEGDSLLTIFTPTSPYPLTRNVPENFTGVNADYSFYVYSYDWVGVCMKSYPTNPVPNNDEDIDLRADDNSDFSSPYQSSTYFLEGAPDLVVTNGHQVGSATHYAQVYEFGGDLTNRDYTIEYEDSYDIAVGASHTASMTGDQILEMYESSLTEVGAPYRVTVEITSGDLDIDLFGFEPTRTDGRRYDNDWQSISGGVGVTESIEFVAATAGVYGFAITNENAGDGTIRVTVERMPECGDASHPYPTGDLNEDCYVEWADFGIFADNWQRNDCAIPGWCQGADMNQDGSVEWADFGTFADHWQDCTHPDPPCSYLP